MRQFTILVEQPLVDTSNKLSNNENRRRLENRGFKTLTGRDKTSPGLNMGTPDGKAVIVDLHDENAFGIPGGGIAVIDCDIRAKESEADSAAPSGGSVARATQARAEDFGTPLFSSGASAAAAGDATARRLMDAFNLGSYRDTDGTVMRDMAKSAMLDRVYARGGDPKLGRRSRKEKRPGRS